MQLIENTIYLLESGHKVKFTKNKLTHYCFTISWVEGFEDGNPFRWPLGQSFTENGYGCQLRSGMKVLGACVETLISELSVKNEQQMPITINGRIRPNIKAEDIKHPNRLTVEQIGDIPSNLVFMWIKTGQWKQKDFNKWLDARVASIENELVEDWVNDVD